MPCRWVSDEYALASRVARLLALLDPECDYDPSKRRNYRGAHKSFFFFLGPVCISSGSTAAFKAYCAFITP
jgi:hypothetical protein